MKKMFEKLKRGLRKMKISVKEFLATLPHPSERFVYLVVRDVIAGAMLTGCLLVLDITKEASAH